MALLCLYPVHFRIRFGTEMACLFHECSHEAIQKGGTRALLLFWLRAGRDLGMSVLRERGREVWVPVNVNHPLIGIADRLLIPTIVTGNLMVLGPILALLAAGGTRIAADQFVLASGFFSVAVGSLAVAASLVLTKIRPTVRLWVKLSA